MTERTPSAAARLSMGEGGTPLVELRLDAGPVTLAKLEFLAPTLSFKDRGAVLVVAAAVDDGARELVADSSGNAGVSFAAYAARAALPCHVFVPAHASPSKLEALEVHGARAHLVEGSRAAATEAARAFLAADPRRGYASHVWSPWFAQGTKHIVLEAVAGLGGAPDALVLPVGNGTLVLGARAAMADLGVTIPIVGVQAAACAPIATAFAEGADAVDAWLAPAATAAEGIAVDAPPRGADVLSAVRATGGRMVSVTDDEIAAAAAVLGRQGLWVEPTGAVAVAAVLAGHADTYRRVLVPLTGAGLKAAAH